MRNMTLVALLCAGAPALVANAQFQSRNASQFGNGSAIEGGAAAYQHDDGSAENGIGFGADVTLLWMNAFQVSGGNNIITAIDLTFGTPDFPGGSGLFGGESFQVHVWQGTPTGAHTLLASASANVDASAIDSNIFQSVAINAMIAGGDGADFFIGATIAQANGTFPAALDQTSSALSSYAAATLTSFDLNNLGLADAPPTLLDTIPGLAGNFMLRAHAIPTPGALGLFGIAGLAAARRRR